MCTACASASTRRCHWIGPPRRAPIITHATTISPKPHGDRRQGQACARRARSSRGVLRSHTKPGAAAPTHTGTRWRAQTRRACFTVSTAAPSHREAGAGNCRQVTSRAGATQRCGHASSPSSPAAAGGGGTGSASTLRVGEGSGPDRLAGATGLTEGVIRGCLLQLVLVIRSPYGPQHG